MIGDSPIVAGFVLVFLLAFLASKGLRRKDPRRCPQCQSLGIELLADQRTDAEPAGFGRPREVECRRCGTPLVRDEGGRLHHRDAWYAKHPAKTDRLGLRS